MKHASVGSALAAIGVLALVLLWVNAIDVNWPWQDVAGNESAVEQPETATITSVQPIALDCRARIHSVVPIEGKREHDVSGHVYRTDTVTMNAVGDIDTCVDAGEVDIITGDDGTTTVLIPADAIEFVRPRVDTVATLDSVVYDKGVLGKLVDAFPWVDDNNTLTPAAYAYAQTVIGSGECMQAAFDVTQQALRSAYRDQAVERGIAAESVRVEIVGQPDFDSVPGPEVLDEFEFSVDENATSCQVDASAYTQYTDESILDDA